ncbi:UNVERIFIED_CONTAM: hypothetical protein GTU68_052653, partial [Idotea baltica]|nr:hypothetical protein [Idotea baltica]
VFVVDDEPFVLQSLAGVLESYGLHAETFASGAAFLAQFDPNRRGCLLIDLKLPDMTGIELYRQIREQGGHMPAIMFSGRGSIPEVSESMRAGAIDFLEKPVDSELLANRVREALIADLEQQGQFELCHELRKRVATFSPRERQVGGFVLDGLTAKQIAERLGIETKTVEVHRSRLVRKAASGSTLEFVRDMASCGTSDSKSFDELLASQSDAKRNG